MSAGPICGSLIVPEHDGNNTITGLVGTRFLHEQLDPLGL